MTTKGLPCAVALLCASIATATLAAQRSKPDYSHVQVTYTDPPADMKTGDEVTTTISFVATDDVDRLEVFLDPDDGLVIVTPPAQTVFTGMKDGDKREIQVKVKLTDPKVSSLNVTYDTVSGAEEGGGAKAITYGDPTN